MTRVKEQMSESLKVVISPKQAEEFNVDKTLNLFNTIFEEMIKNNKEKL